MQVPELSIIVTCYNLAKYLDEALESVFDQTYANWECIIVNDGSHDNTEEVATKWIKKDSRFVYLYKDNGGVSSARNLGIRKSKGKYIIPLDADNKLRSEFVSQTIYILDSMKDVDVVYGDAQLFGNKIFLLRGKPFNIGEMVLINYIDTCAGFRKSAWEDIGGYDANMPVYGFEDWDLWLRMAVKGYQFYYLETVLFDYRVRNNSLLSEAWKERPLLIDYIFNKEELKNLAILREYVIENQRLNEEPSFNSLIKIIIKKIKRKLHF